jgi:flagellar protein FliS
LDEQTERTRPDLTYLRSEVETADPLKLLVMLYNRLLRELREIKDDLKANEAGAGDEAGGAGYLKTLPKFKKCREILYYLLDSLDPAGGEVSLQLTSMYSYFLQKILAAEVEKDGRFIDEILPNVETLREGWLGVAERVKTT